MAQRAADILCIGLDSAAMQTRLLILQRAGHNVIQARDLRRVKIACETVLYDIAIIGQSLSCNEKRRISDAVVAACKTAKILELHTSIAPELPEAGAHLQANAMEPEVLIETVGTVLGTERKKKARSG
jgi:hypothetical protein